MSHLKAFVVARDLGPRIQDLKSLDIDLHIWQSDVVPTSDQVLSELDRIKPQILIKIGTDNLTIRGTFLEQLAQKGIQIIASRSTGLNLIDLQRTTELGIPVIHAPEVPSVAEYAIGLLISLLRREHYALGVVTQGQWGLTKLEVAEEMGFCGKTLAIIGVGRIGKSLAVKSLGLGFQKILLHDIQPDPRFLEKCQQAAERFHELRDYVLAAGKKGITECKYVDRETALEEGDIISLHLPLTTPSESEHPTFHYLSESEFAIMKKKPVVINTARGPVIDTPALIDALEHERIGGAVLDVVENEPLRPGDPFFESLAGRDNVILSPHYCSRTVQTFNYMAEQVVKGISYVINKVPPEGRTSIANPEVLESFQMEPVSSRPE